MTDKEIYRKHWDKLINNMSDDVLAATVRVINSEASPHEWSLHEWLRNEFEYRQGNELVMDDED